MTKRELCQSGENSLPMKRYYRQRAHSNPFSDHCFNYPSNPDQMDWTELYPNDRDQFSDPIVRFVDVGCGYGGLLFSLSQMFPQILSLGIEIRLKVFDYVQEKIKVLRSTKNDGSYENIACVRSNAMKFLPNFFYKNQLKKIFFLYPDPHFKRVKHKWRIISPTLLDTYAYLLSFTGRLYTTTDVPDLAVWNLKCLSNHALFKPVCCIHLKPCASITNIQSDMIVGDFSLTIDMFNDYPYLIRTVDQLNSVILLDPVIGLLTKGCTEESAKATREGRETIILVFERIPNPDWL